MVGRIYEKVRFNPRVCKGVMDDNSDDEVTVLGSGRKIKVGDIGMRLS